MITIDCSCYNPDNRYFIGVCVDVFLRIKLLCLIKNYTPAQLLHLRGTYLVNQCLVRSIMLILPFSHVYTREHICVYIRSIEASLVGIRVSYATQ